MLFRVWVWIVAPQQAPKPQVRSGDPGQKDLPVNKPYDTLHPHLPSHTLAVGLNLKFGV
jgi:hypothetical protein